MAAPSENRRSERIALRVIAETEGHQPSATPIVRRYEALISYVQGLANGGRNFERPFVVPGVTPDHDGNRITRAETSAPSIINHIRQLPEELRLMITRHLSGNDQVMLAMASRSSAEFVLGINTPRHANISYYEFTARSNQLSRLPDAQNPFIHLSDTFYHDPTAENMDIPTMQRDELHDRVGDHLGSDYAYCNQCCKFRVLDQNWWVEFMEYEYPGLDAGSSARGILTAECQRWVDRANDPTRPWNDCPAHAILRENGDGQRTILTRRY